MEKAIVSVILCILLSASVAGCLGGEEDPIDTDGDGVFDDEDAFPYNKNETTDTDNDGRGDNSDAFPSDPNEWDDSDGDGTGDKADAFPNNANETKDTDGDGVGDNSDAFPDDANETLDTDGDGVGDNSDAFPDDANETLDTDGDGVGDNSDLFPDVSNEIEYKIGDRCTRRFTDDEGNSRYFDYIVVSTSFLYQGKEVMVSDATVSSSGFESDGWIFDNLTGEGQLYMNKTSKDSVYLELETNTRVKQDIDDDWIEYRTVMIQSLTNSGGCMNIDFQIGDSWSVTSTIVTNTTSWLDGIEMSNEETTETEVINYEILGIRNISVAAGTFDCLEIREDTLGEDGYSLLYRSPSTKFLAKSIDYTGDTISELSELISYSLA